MGEAKRCERTLDGGPLNDNKIVLQVEIFTPRRAADKDNKLRLAAMAAVYEKMHQRPTPICAACDYEFDFGQPPAALFCTRPMFPKSNAFIFLSSAICPRCAQRPTDELVAAVIDYLRAVKPDITIVEMGRA